MDKKTQNKILIGGGILLLLYLIYKSITKERGTDIICTNKCCDNNGTEINAEIGNNCVCASSSYIHDGTACVSNVSPTIVYGCTDSSASNYNSLATQDDGSCTHVSTPTPVFTTLGCTDPLATNYNASATQDDGSCNYGQQARTCYSACSGSGFTTIYTTSQCGQGSASNFPYNSAPYCNTPRN